MSSSISELKQIFEYELKRKLSQKSRNLIEEMKTLINCFKYYDINNEEEIDKSIWIKGILRTGLSGFGEDDLDTLYNSYVQNNSGKINYKDFCNYIYERQSSDSISQKNLNAYFTENNNISNKKNYIYNNIQKIDLNNYNKNYSIRQNKGNKNLNNNINNYNNTNNLETPTNNNSESLNNKMKEIIHVDNGVVFYSFLKFLKINEEPTSQKVSFEDLSVTIQELHLNISSSELHEFFNNLDSEKTGRISIDNIINIIKGPLDEKRKSYISTIFSNIDTEKTGEISINTLKNIYNSKNHPDVLNGKKTEEEVYNQFCYTIDVYVRINKILSNSLNKEQFIDYYSGISPSLKNDEDFKNILSKVWNSDKLKNNFSNKNKNNDLNNDYINTFGDNDIGINSIFLGVSKSKRPKYDYNYDYLEELSKSSSNIKDNKKAINNNNNNDKNLINYSYKKLNQNSIRNNSRNKNLSNLGENIIYDSYKSLNANQTISYSNTLPIENQNNYRNGQTKYFNYESRKTPQYRGIKVFKSKLSNPITDAYIQEDINNNINNTTNNINYKNIINNDIQNNILTPRNYENTNNNYNKNNNLNYFIKEEINSNENNNIKEDLIQNRISNNNNLEEDMNNYTNDTIKENSSLIKFRKILISRGTKSIFRFQRMLSIYDRNHSGLISYDNFYTIFQAYNINILISDIKSIFSLFATSNDNLNNKNNNNKDTSLLKIKYDDLLKSLIGNMSSRRQLIVKKVFDSFNKDNEGKIMTSDIKTKFNSDRHPDVLNGKSTANEIYSDFLDFLETFREYNDNLKGGFSFNMSFEEFCNFYNEISMSIEDDNYFEYLLNNCWNIEPENNNQNINENNNYYEFNVENNNQNLIHQENNLINNGLNNNININNNYQRRVQYNNGNNVNNGINNNEYSNNIRMKLGSQIINNRIF